MENYFSNKEELRRVIEDALKKAVLNELPSALKNATRQKWLTTKDVTNYLKCTENHVQHLRNSGKLPFRQHSSMIRYNVDDIETYLNKKISK